MFYISRRKLSHYHPEHLHGFFEILYLATGERLFFINDRTFKMTAGDLIIINPNVIHNATSEGLSDGEGTLLYFQEEFLSPNYPLREELQPMFLNANIYLTLSRNAQAFIEEHFSKMLQEALSKKTGHQLALQSLLLHLLVFICRYVENYDTTTIEHPSPMHKKVSEIVRYINAHYMEELSLNYLANHFYISPSYLSKVFKKATNFTFIEYLNNVRIKEAKRLLMESSKKVVEIAEEVGFGSITHFGRVFKEITGKAPVYYRRIQK